MKSKKEINKIQITFENLFSSPLLYTAFVCKYLYMNTTLEFLDSDSDAKLAKCT